MGIDNGIRPGQMTRDPHFSPVAPPKDWEAHFVPLTQRRLQTRVGAIWIITPAHRPVPRRANCHYLAVDRNRHNVYFY